MALVILTAEYTYQSVLFVANDVIDLPSDQVNFLLSFDPDKARSIVAGPAEWSAGSYVANNLVSKDGTYYVNDANVVAGEVPGADANWVAVRYLPNAPGVVIPETPGGSGIAAVGFNYKIEDGYLYAKDEETGSFYKHGATSVDGAPVPLLKP